jgi:uncharacterized alkaline shock family protein YloU
MIDPDPAAIATAVEACPNVVEMSGGAMGTVATYLPGRRIVGVRVHNANLEVHVVGRWDVPIPTLASEIRAAVTPLLTPGRNVEVVVEDVGDPPLSDSAARP